MSNPFWKDAFLSLHYAKPCTKISINELLSLDILNFIPVKDFYFYLNWQNYGIKHLKDIFDIERKDFCTFEQVRQKTGTSNFLKYYMLLSNIPRYIKLCIKENCANINLDNFVVFDAFLNR